MSADFQLRARKPLTFEKDLIDEVRKSMERIEPRVKPQLKKSIEKLKKELSSFEGKNITEALEILDKVHVSKEK